MFNFAQLHTVHNCTIGLLHIVHICNIAWHKEWFAQLHDWTIAQCSQLQQIWIGLQMSAAIKLPATWCILTTPRNSQAGLARAEHWKKQAQKTEKVEVRLASNTKVRVILHLEPVVKCQVASVEVYSIQTYRSSVEVCIVIYVCVQCSLYIDYIWKIKDEGTLILAHE